MRTDALVVSLRRDSRLSVRALAAAAGVAASTVHRIERGDLHPTVELLERITKAAGMRLRLDTEVDYAASLVGLARCLGDGEPIRMAAELAHRYRAADSITRARMITAEPAPTGDERWDAFLGGLAEWLAVTTDEAAPGWVHDDSRFLARGWWVTPMRSMRAWEYAGTPAAFKIRGVFLHRDSLRNV
ncbi:MAG TPA: helix-turn-helix domain-containing protein [Acidimicrobiales bacterium]|nr:helix-turn-helix domain-containing protein [Acidimicrobiales bacterium]